jgi:hypothetical protein
MKNRLVTAASLFTLALAAGPAWAASVVNHYETDLQNYRICAGTQAELGSCKTSDGANGTRSPSRLHLPDGSQGSITVTSSNVVKLKIEGLKMDNNVDFPCAQEPYTCSCNLPNCGGTCITKPIGAPAKGCDADADCDYDTCQGGPKDRHYCDNQASESAECETMDNHAAVGAVVFHGNASGVVLTSFPFTELKIFGDGGDPVAGCMKVCPFGTTADATPDGVGEVDSNSLTCDAGPKSCTGGSNFGAACVTGTQCPGATCGGPCSMLTTYHSVEIVDFEGNIVAVPGLGDASIITTSPMGGDVASDGDVCRPEKYVLPATPPVYCP